MNRRAHELLSNWLTAEGRAREAAAERALVEFFRLLPQAVPSPGFADRVVAAAWPRPVLQLSWPMRVAIATCLLLAGLSTIFLMPIVLRLVRLVAPGDVIASLVDAFLALVDRLVGLLVVWQWVASLGESLLVVVTSPPVVVTLLGMTTLSALAYRSLSALLNPHRSSRYVEAY